VATQPQHPLRHIKISGTLHFIYSKQIIHCVTIFLMLVLLNLFVCTICSRWHRKCNHFFHHQSF